MRKYYKVQVLGNPKIQWAYVEKPLKAIYSQWSDEKEGYVWVDTITKEHVEYKLFHEILNEIYAPRAIEFDYTNQEWRVQIAIKKTFWQKLKELFNFN